MRISFRKIFSLQIKQLSSFEVEYSIPKLVISFGQRGPSAALFLATSENFGSSLVKMTSWSSYLSLSKFSISSENFGWWSWKKQSLWYQIGSFPSCSFDWIVESKKNPELIPKDGGKISKCDQDVRNKSERLTKVNLTWF